MALQPADWEWPVRQLRLEVPLQDSVPDPGESFLLLHMNLRFPREHAQGWEPGEGGMRPAGISQLQLVWPMETWCSLCITDWKMMARSGRMESNLTLGN